MHFKAICAFFKNIFSKNKETIESTKKENNSKSDNKTTQTSTTTQSKKQKDPKQAPKRTFDDFYKDICIDACKHPSKYGIDDKLYIADDTKNIITFADTFTSAIINTVNDISSDLEDRYDTLINIFDDDLRL